MIYWLQRSSKVTKDVKLAFVATRGPKWGEVCCNAINSKLLLQEDRGWFVLQVVNWYTPCMFTLITLLLNCSSLLWKCCAQVYDSPGMNYHYNKIVYWSVPGVPLSITLLRKQFRTDIKGPLNILCVDSSNIIKNLHMKHTPHIMQYCCSMFRPLNALQHICQYHYYIS